MKKIFKYHNLIIISYVFLLGLLVYIFNSDYYLGLYEKNGVYDYIDKQDAAKLTVQMIDFFKENKDFESFELKNNLPYFTQNEISHLEDVRVLFNKIFLAYYICLALTIVSIAFLIEKNKRKFLKNLSLLMIIPSAVLISLLLILYLFGQNFLPLFDKFHTIFFPQGNFAFPADSTLITLLPLGFFTDFFVKLVVFALIIAAALIITGSAISIIIKKHYK